MAKDKDNKYLWLILLAVLVGIFFFKEKVNPIEQQDDSLIDYLEDDICAGECNPELDDGTQFLQVTFYDSNGNPVTGSSMTQSIVNGVPGIASIGVTAKVTNSGSYALSCILKDISPAAFDTAMDKSNKVVNLAQQVTWSSSAIPVAPFEGLGPITFTVDALCTYNPGTGNVNLAEKNGQFQLTVTSEGVASFTFSVPGPTGIPTEYCGDGTCNNGETTLTCAQDCPAAPANIKFRTSDNTYAIGSAIAFTSTCGNTLTAYGMNSESNAGGTTTGTCPSSLSGHNLLLANLPGSTVGCPTCTGPICLYEYSATQIWLSRYKPAYGWWYYAYVTSDPDASKVSTAKESTQNPLLEVEC